jgi:hypothetical protein
MHWDKVSNGSRGMDWLEFIDAIRSIKRGQLWRHNQAGDLPGNGNRISSRMMMDLVEANKGKRGYTYTHKPLTDANIKLIEHANANGFTVNVSTNNINELDNARSKTKSSPLVTVLPLNSPKIQKTSQGMTVLKCPAQTTDISCFECGLCQNASRSFAIGFEVHGTGKNRISKELAQCK